MTPTPRKRKEIHTLLPLGPSTLVSGSVASVRDTESKSGLMEPNTRASGKIIEPMARENSLISMVMSMMASGSMIKLTAMVSITILMEPCMRDTGVTISNTEKVVNPGQMGPSTRASTKQVKNMV